MHMFFFYSRSHSLFGVLVQIADRSCSARNILLQVACRDVLLRRV